MMRAKRKSQNEASLLASAESDNTINPIARNLIDELIVPKLVEDFLHQYGPASSIEQALPSYRLWPDSELNSTP